MGKEDNVIEGIVAVLAGLLLISPIIRGGSAGGKVVGRLAPFDAVIGVVAVVVGVLTTLRKRKRGRSE
jgi:hypothetical protein